jgi:signal transduction histidine kinase/CheY-like chemotaxis protein
MSDSIEVLKRALERERASRKAVEQLLEAKSRELYDAHQTLKEQLERQVVERTHELELARDHAIEASRAKSQFLAKMSHELRTPLNAILGYSEMLEEDARAEGRTRDSDDLRKIQIAGKHLLALINDVLDLSKIEAGQIAAYIEDVDLGALVDEVCSTVRPIVEKNGNKLLVRVATDLGHGDIDVTKVRQTLFNLLSNAAKFTEKGEVELSALRTSDGVEFAVRDTGIGLTPEQIGNIFLPFRQADAATSRKYGGTGLGLAISQRFAQLLGGDIVVESELGKGSTFRLVLPAKSLKPAALEPESSSVPASGGRGTVLVIDDDATSRELLGRHITAEGFGVVHARDGKEGVELARTLRPFLITLDVMMPQIDGWSVLAALRADPELCEIPVVIVTVLGDRALALGMGASDHISKPVERERLAAMLARYADASATILVVDDDPDARDLMARAAREAGCRPVLVSSAREAQAALQTTQPGLILLDLMMPDMDGFELIDWLRANDRFVEVPVVVITAKELSPDDHERLGGAAAFVLDKPSTSHRELSKFLRNVAKQTRITEIALESAEA